MEGLSLEQARTMAGNLQFKDPLLDTAAKQIQQLYELFLSVDATQVEINPFGETPDGRGMCIFKEAGTVNQLCNCFSCVL